MKKQENVTYSKGQWIETKLEMTHLLGLANIATMIPVLKDVKKKSLKQCTGKLSQQKNRNYTITTLKF